MEMGSCRVAGRIILALGAVLRVVNAADPVAFEHLGAEQGLSQQVVRCIAQDRTGYMWFGTQDGLNKYDGYTFTVYRHDPDDPHSLPNNSVAAIYEDHDGILWVGTSGGGLSRYDATLDNFGNFQNNPARSQTLSDNAVTFIREDRANNLWIGTEHGGLNRFDRSSSAFIHYRHNALDPQSLGEDDVRAFYQDRDGLIWLGTRRSGLERFNPGSGHFDHFKPERSLAQSLSSATVFSIYEDRLGRIWIGTGNGLNQFDRAQQTFRHFQASVKADIESQELAVYSMTIAKSGGFWLGTGDGLEHFDGGDQFTRYRHDPFDRTSLTHNIVYSTYEDRAGNLWVGTEGGGLNRYNPSNWRFRTYRSHPGDPASLNNSIVRAIFKDGAGTLWIGTDGGGLTSYSKDRRAPSVFEHKFGVTNSLASNYVNALWGDSAGAMWVGTRDGLDRLDPQNQTFTHFSRDSANPRSLSNNLVFFLHQDRHGALWVGTQGGLNRLERGGKSFERYEHDPANSNSLGENDIRAFAEDADGTFWIGTRHAGLDHFDPVKKTFAHLRHNPLDSHTLTSNAVYALLLSHTGDLWAGTTEGVQVLDRRNGTFMHFTEKDGLPNNTVYGILGDREGRLWMSTDRGLSEMNPNTRTFRNYDIDDGLQGNEFNGGAAFASSDGELFFGGVNGMNSFYPDKLQASQYVPPIVITGVRVLDRPVKGFGSAPPIQLSYKDYVFSAEFASLDFAAPLKNRYAYKLEGLDHDWTYSGSRRIAIYTNLEPGHYLLRVKGTNSDGIWTGLETTLPLNVTPPMWKRWWFLALVAAITVGFTAWSYRRRISELEQARIAQESFSRRLIESQEAERKRIAAELHDGLGQNLLVIKNHALLGLAGNGAPANAANQFDEISSTASLALDEVREIARALRPYQLDRLGLTKAVESICRRAANSSTISFSIQIDPIDKLFSSENEINLYRVIQESVNNILKHSQATSALVTVSKEPRRLFVRIEDNGKGFDLTSATNGFGLTGIGERARILSAKHTVQSIPGHGVKVGLEIPLNNDHHAL